LAKTTKSLVFHIKNNPFLAFLGISTWAMRDSTQFCLLIFFLKVFYLDTKLFIGKIIIKKKLNYDSQNILFS
jgi:hypothetical protein